jgi:hypothetical protein
MAATPARHPHSIARRLSQCGDDRDRAARILRSRLEDRIRPRRAQWYRVNSDSIGGGRAGGAKGNSQETWVQGPRGDCASGRKTAFTENTPPPARGARRAAIPHERGSSWAEVHQRYRSRSGVFVCFVRSRPLRSGGVVRPFRSSLLSLRRGTKPGHVPLSGRIRHLVRLRAS